MIPVSDIMKKQLFICDLNTGTKKCKCISLILALCICFVIFQTPAMAFSEYASNGNNTYNVFDPTDQNKISESSHLIELYFEDNNYILAGESVVYSIADENNNTELVMWIPENAEILQFLAADMMRGSSAIPINFSRQDDLLYFAEDQNISFGGMPLLYEIRYTVHSHEETATFTKIIREEDYFGYPVSRLILLVHHQEDEIPSVTLADGTPIIADEVNSEATQTAYIWSAPQFNDFSVILQKNSYAPTTESSPESSVNSLIVPGIVALVIVGAAVLYYKHDSGNIDKLEDIYEAELAVIARIKEDRKKNVLSKDEYESILQKHANNAEKVKSKMEKLKKT